MKAHPRDTPARIKRRGQHKAHNSVQRRLLRTGAAEQVTLHVVHEGALCAVTIKAFDAARVEGHAEVVALGGTSGLRGKRLMVCWYGTKDGGWLDTQGGKSYRNPPDEWIWGVVVKIERLAGGSGG